MASQKAQRLYNNLCPRTRRPRDCGAWVNPAQGLTPSALEKRSLDIRIKILNTFRATLPMASFERENVKRAQQEISAHVSPLSDSGSVPSNIGHVAEKGSPHQQHFPSTLVTDWTQWSYFSSHRFCPMMIKKATDLTKVRSENL